MSNEFQQALFPGFQRLTLLDYVFVVVIHGIDALALMSHHQPGDKLVDANS